MMLFGFYRLVLMVNVLLLNVGIRRLKYGVQNEKYPFSFLIAMGML